MRNDRSKCGPEEDGPTTLSRRKLLEEEIKNGILLSIPEGIPASEVSVAMSASEPRAGDDELKAASELYSELGMTPDG